jgi:integrase
VPIDKITRRDVIALLDEVSNDGQPYVGVNLHKELRTMFNWAVDRELIDLSPVGKYVAPVRPTSRDRVLSDDELRSVWHGCNALGYPFGPLVQMLILTAQRRTETARMVWDHLDLDRRLWVIPAELTKSDRTHTVPLSPAAEDIITALPRGTGSFVFSTTAGKKPVSGYSKAKRRLDEISGVSDWRLHDLRRTAASGMARLGVAPQVLARVLNHAPGRSEGVTAIYNRYGYDEEKRDALSNWSRWVSEVCQS